MLDTIFSLLLMALLTLPEPLLLILLLTLFFYLHTPKENVEQRRKFRFWMIVEGVIFGVLIAALACLMILSGGAITHM